MREKLGPDHEKLGRRGSPVCARWNSHGAGELEGGNLIWEYYMKLDRSENGYVSKLGGSDQDTIWEKLPEHGPFLEGNGSQRQLFK